MQPLKIEFVHRWAHKLNEIRYQMIEYKLTVDIFLTQLSNCQLIPIFFNEKKHNCFYH